MIYTEYAKAAERHLETCTHLVHVIEEQYQKKESNTGLSPRETKEKLELLSNLYYLSGYIIECVYSYALCNAIAGSNPGDLNPTTDVYNQLKSTSVKSITWFQKSKLSLGATHAVFRGKHKMSSNEMSYFLSLGSSINPIPILSGNNMSSTAAQTLFDDWSAEVRYSISASLNYTNVFEFFWECEKIYRLTRQIITVDY